MTYIRCIWFLEKVKFCLTVVFKYVTFSQRIFEKYIKTVNKICSIEWIPSNSYTQRLAETN